MASTLHAFSCAVFALVFWTCLGYPVVRRLIGGSLSLSFAPLVGWAMHSTVALPIFFLIPFSPFDISVVAILCATATLLAARSTGIAGPIPIGGATTRRSSTRSLADATSRSGAVAIEPVIPVWALVAAGLLAVVTAAAIAPKYAGDAVMLSDQIFDHSKVAMIDDMARLGLPPGNPFLAHDGQSGKLAYYYLWYFSAAELARVFGITGWEADIAMTFFSAFTSLILMMAIAVRLSGRRLASYWVVALAASGSSRVILLWLFGGATLDAWLPPPGGFGGWLFQSSWVPQHLASTSCVLAAVYLMNKLTVQRSVLAVVALALVITAGFESSTWIGGVVFAISSLLMVPLLVVQLPAAKRRSFVLSLACVALLSALLAWPFLVDQANAAARRTSGFPIAIHLFGVLGEAIPEGLRRSLDAPAFWVAVLPIELSAVYVTGLVVMARLTKRRAGSSADRRLVSSLSTVGLTALLVSWLLESTLADNNDLGWRAALLATTILIVFSAVGLASWIADRRWFATGLALGAIALGLPETAREIYGNFHGVRSPGAEQFAEAPSVWKEVRANSGPAERIANNPAAFQQMTPWPVNISWSLLADRRSCYAGWELTQVYTSVPHAKLQEIDAEFKRIFKGSGSEEDIKDLATKYDCGVAVVTPEDGAWERDPFGHNPAFKLVSESPHWRIYRRRAEARQ